MVQWQAVPYRARSEHVGLVVDKVTLAQVFAEYFGFPCQSSFHPIIRHHHHHIIIIICFVRLLALRALLAYCASLG
jgi:catechol-2,3-dioxygenase